MFAHPVSLRWALYVEEWLQYDTNIGLLTTVQRLHDLMVDSRVSLEKGWLGQKTIHDVVLAVNVDNLFCKRLAQILLHLQVPRC